MTSPALRGTATSPSSVVTFTNYQRYPVTLEDGRLITYVVAGGSGAFTHGTHKIARIDDPDDGVEAQMPARAGARVGLTEEESHLFPPRAWSLYWFVTRLARRSPVGVPDISYIDAAAMIGDALGLQPLDPRAREALERYRRDGMPVHLRATQALFFRWLPAPGGVFQRFAAEFLDWERPAAC